MSENVERHDTSMPLTTDPAQHPAVFAAAFNSGDPAALEQMYEDRGIVVPRPGQPATGADRLAANTHFQSLGIPIEVRTRHVYAVDDIALLIVDWSIDGTATDGTRIDVHGTATDVARRGPDGTWRYVIDNPFGTHIEVEN